MGIVHGNATGWESKTHSHRPLNCTVVVWLNGQLPLSLSNELCYPDRHAVCVFKVGAVERVTAWL